MRQWQIRPNLPCSAKRLIGVLLTVVAVASSLACVSAQQRDISGGDEPTQRVLPLPQGGQPDPLQQVRWMQQLRALLHSAADENRSDADSHGTRRDEDSRESSPFDSLTPEQLQSMQSLLQRFMQAQSDGRTPPEIPGDSSGELSDLLSDPRVSGRLQRALEQFSRTRQLPRGTGSGAAGLPPGFPEIPPEVISRALSDPTVRERVRQMVDDMRQNGSLPPTPGGGPTGRDPGSDAETPFPPELTPDAASRLFSDPMVQQEIQRQLQQWNNGSDTSGRGPRPGGASAPDVPTNAGASGGQNPSGPPSDGIPGPIQDWLRGMRNSARRPVNAPQAPSGNGSTGRGSANNAEAFSPTPPDNSNPLGLTPEQDGTETPRSTNPGERNSTERSSRDSNADAGGRNQPAGGTSGTSDRDRRGTSAGEANRSGQGVPGFSGTGRPTDPTELSMTPEQIEAMLRQLTPGNGSPEGTGVTDPEGDGSGPGGTGGFGGNLQMTPELRNEVEQLVRSWSQQQSGGGSGGGNRPGESGTSEGQQSPGMTVGGSASGRANPWGGGQSGQARSTGQTGRGSGSGPVDIESELRRSGLRGTFQKLMDQAKSQVREDSIARSEAGSGPWNREGSAGRGISGRNPLSDAVPNGNGPGDGSLDRLLNDVTRDVTRIARDGGFRNSSGESSGGSSSRGPDSGAFRDASRSASDFFNRISQAPASGGGGSAIGSGFSGGSELVGPGATGLGGVVLIVLLAAIVIGVVLLLLRTQSLARGGREQREGALPEIRPSEIRTREDVVRAFHQFALRPFTTAQAWWTHREVAGTVAQKVPATAEALERLADVYEYARYLPPNSELTVEQLQTARRSLEVCSAGVES